MQTVSNAIVSQTVSASANGSAGTANAAAGAGFGQMLVQAMGGSSSGESVSGSLPSLVQVLEGLFANLPVDVASESPESNEAEAWGDLLTRLQDQPELLDQLFESDEMQEWLMQAAMLLQGMQKLPEDLVSVVLPERQDKEGSLDQLPASEDMNQLLMQETMMLQGSQKLNAEQASVDLPEQNQEPTAASTETAMVNRRQALEIVKAFAQASLEQPDNVFLEQLREKLSALTAAAGSTKSGKDRNVLSAGSVNIGSINQELSGKIQTATVVSHTSRLEMLAAKSMPINRLETLLGDARQTEAQPSTPSLSEEGGLPVALPQDFNRIAPHKAALPAEAVVRAETLAEDMSKFLLGKLRIQAGGGVTEARLTLTPESLGQVDVKLTLANGQLVAHFAAQTALGKDAIEAQLQQLRTALQNQGIQVEKLEVTQSTSLQSGMFQDQRQQQQSRQFSRQSESKSSAGGSEDYAAEASAILNGGRNQETDGFDVTA